MRRIPSLFLLLLLITLSGCIVTYGDFPHTTPPSHVAEPLTRPRCHQTVQFSYGVAEGGMYQWTSIGALSPARVRRALHDALQQYAGCSSGPDPVDNATWPETEVVVSVHEKPYPWHWYGEYLGRISAQIALIIPFYINEGGWEFSYAIYDEQGLKKTYTYDITAKHFYWVVLLPLSWINVFTDSLDNAVHSTTAQFVLDAQRDRYLKTKT